MESRISLRAVALALGLVIAACHRGTVVTPPPPAAKPAPAPAAAPLASVVAWVKAMYDRYQGKWYRTLTFTQKTTLGLASGGELVQTWYEAMELPGRLRIDTDLANKGGVLFARDSIFRFVNGKLTQSDTGVNEALLLGFDVYAQPASKTIAELRHRGFELSKVHEGTWQERPVYVIGAARGDTVSRQFWVDRERRVFVR